MKDSKMFWSEVRSICVGTCRQPLISTNEWFTHFKNVLGGDTNQDKGEEDYADPPGVEGLDSSISEEEVRSSSIERRFRGPPGLGFGLGLVAASFHSLFFLFACPLVSRIISFIYDVQVRGGGLDVSRDLSFCLCS